MSNETVTTNPEETVQEFQQQDLINAEPPAEQPPADQPAAEQPPAPATGKKKGKAAESATVTDEGVCELDRTKDYGQVWGMPGVAFEQDHKYFNMEGFEVKPELEA